MNIFDKHIFGDDAKQWMELSVEDKVDWIRKYTNQQDDAIIEEFINNPNISKDKICLTCGEKASFIVEEKPVVKKSKKKI